MAAAALEEAGYQVVAVSGAGEAVLQKDDIDLSLIVLDLDLRRMRDQGADQCLRKGTMSELVAAVQSAAD